MKFIHCISINSLQPFVFSWNDLGSRKKARSTLVFFSLSRVLLLWLLLLLLPRHCSWIKQLRLLGQNLRTNYSPHPGQRNHAACLFLVFLVVASSWANRSNHQQRRACLQVPASPGSPERRKRKSRSQK